MKNSGRKVLVLASFLILGLTLTSATDLQNIESITPKGTANINVNGTLDLNGNNPVVGITNLKGSGIVNSGQVSSGAIGLSELNTGDVDTRYLNRGGDSMNGNLDMNGNDINSGGSLTVDNISLNGGYGTGGIDLNNERLFGLDSFSINDPGTDGAIDWSGANAQVYVAPLDDSNSDGYLQLVNDGGIAFEPGSDGSTAATFNTNNNLDMQTNKITNLQDPTSNQEAATKGYVDTSDDTIADDQNLTEVLSNGNTAGTYDIDMKDKNLKNPNCIGDFC